jgi:hypothetical protein
MANKSWDVITQQKLRGAPPHLTGLVNDVNDVIYKKCVACVNYVVFVIYAIYIFVSLRQLYIIWIQVLATQAPMIYHTNVKNYTSRLPD